MGNVAKDQMMKYLAGNFTCKEIADIITEYLEGAMPFWDRVRFQWHLGMCGGCRNYLSQMKQTVATLGKLPAEPIPEHIREELLNRFRDWKKSAKE